MDIKKLKMLLGVGGSAQDGILQFIMDDVAESIKNYCHITAIPSGLENTAYRMAMDLYRGENFGSATPDSGLIASQSEGDTSVSYRVNETFAQSLLKNYYSQLNRYRVLSWT